MFVLNLIHEIVEFISNLPGAVFVIRWIKNHVGLWIIGILTSLIFIFVYSGVSKIIIYPYPDGEYNLTLIEKADMEKVCRNREFYRMELTELEGSDFEERYDVDFLNIENMENMPKYKGSLKDILPAYRLRCLYRLDRKDNNQNNVESNLSSQSRGAIPSKFKMVDTGLDLENFYCRKKVKNEKYRYRFVFINYKDPYSSFCIKDTDVEVN